MDRKDSNSPKSFWLEKGTMRHRGVFDGVLVVVVYYSPSAHQRQSRVAAFVHSIFASCIVKHLRSFPHVIFACRESVSKSLSLGKKRFLEAVL